MLKTDLDKQTDLVEKNAKDKPKHKHRYTHMNRACEWAQLTHKTSQDSSGLTIVSLILNTVRT